MNRRNAIVIAILLVVLAVVVIEHSRRSERIARVGFLGVDSVLQAPMLAALKEGLRESGYVEGRNIVLETRWADGHIDRLPQLASGLVDANVDVIVTALPAGIRAAQHATTSVPIVMTSNDPVGMGFIASFAHPGANITGPAHPDLQLSAKRLDLLRQLLPGLSRVAILWNDKGFGVGATQIVENAARPLDIQTLTLEIRTPEDFSTAIAAAKAWGAQGAVELFSPVFGAHRRELLDVLNANRLPTICDSRLYTVDGCLMSYGSNILAAFRRMGYYIDRILKGAKPADLPVELTREYDYVINLKTAQSLGITVSTELLLQATEVIR